MAKKYENIENIGKLITDGIVAELTRKIGAAEKNASDIMKRLVELENAKQAKKLEEERLAAEKLAAEENARREAEAAQKAAEEAALAAKTAAEKRPSPLPKRRKKSPRKQ